MKDLRINKLKIKGFKVFDNVEINFDSADLIVFDGPNGFGKTSIFDALELVFTGEIRRYKELEKVVVDGRQKFINHPFLHLDKAEEISIAVEFTSNGKTVVMERLAKIDDLSEKIDFKPYKLYFKDKLNSDHKSPIHNENDYLTELLGENYKDDFNFLNYIEQEETLFLLKQKDADRKNALAYLFNISEFEAKTEKIKLLHKKISELCNRNQEEELERLNREVEEIKEELQRENPEEKNYFSLFPGREIPWDKRDFNFKSITYEDLIGKDGVLNRLKIFLKNKEDFKKYRFNQRVDNLIKDIYQVKNFLSYFNFIESKDDLIKQHSRYEKLKEVTEVLGKVSLQNIESWPKLEGEEIEQNLKNRYEQKKDEIQKEIEEATKLDTIYSNVLETRKKLEEQLISLKDQKVLESNRCVFCGHDWEKIEFLLEGINEQSERLKSLLSEKSVTINNKFVNFKKEEIAEIINNLKKQANKLKIDKSFIMGLRTQKEQNILSIKEKLDFVGFDYENIINKNLYINEESINEKGIKKKLEALIKPIEIGNIRDYYEEYFLIFFGEDYDVVDSFDEEKIESKRKYIEYLYLLNRNELLRVKERKLGEQKELFDKSKKIERKLKSLRKIYENSQREFQRKVIKDIEILFHIYSGRILQNTQNRSGLFIYSETNGIRFQTKPGADYDALFSMSSGQLSALILAFTLSMHKIYAQNNLIFIDDPVQTMDELNMVGFIDLLREEFSQSQLFISTHEDRISSYLRYRFEAFNLNEKRISLKKLSYN